MAKKQAYVSNKSRLHLECPFCGHLVDKLTHMKWCGNCFVEWYESRGNYWFDDKRKTPRFAVAKAIGKAAKEDGITYSIGKLKRDSDTTEET